MCVRSPSSCLHDSLGNQAVSWGCANCQLDSFGTGSFLLAIVPILSGTGLPIEPVLFGLWPESFGSKLFY